MNKRLLFGGLAGVTVFAAVNGSAASLGTISSGGLGAASADVASCDSDGISSSYTTDYNATAAGYEVKNVTVGGIATACDAKQMKVTLVNASNASLGQIVVANLATNQVGTGTAVLDFGTSLDVLAANVHKIHVTIGG